MNIKEFIEERYPVIDKIKARLENPYKRIEEADDLPFDKIGPDEMGTITKLVEVEDNRFVSVMELIGYTREEVVGLKDIALLTAYDAYMSQIDIQDLNIIDILSSVRDYQKVLKNREEQLGVLSL